MKLVLLCLFSVVFNSGWRRWFGGGFKNTWLGNLRGVQCIVYLIVTGLMAYFLEPLAIWWHNLIFAIVFAGYSYVQFWARAIGPALDSGREEYPSEDTIRRYNKSWYHYPCDWICGEHKYGFLYDFLFFIFRYATPTVTLCLLAYIPYLFGINMHIISWHLVFIGLLVSPLYAVSWTLYEHDTWLFEKYRTLEYPTNLAEYLSGAVWGFWVLCVN